MKILPNSEFEPSERGRKRRAEPLVGHGLRVLPRELGLRRPTLVHCLREMEDHASFIGTGTLPSCAIRREASDASIKSPLNRCRIDRIALAYYPKRSQRNADCLNLQGVKEALEANGSNLAIHEGNLRRNQLRHPRYGSRRHHLAEVQ